MAKKPTVPRVIQNKIKQFLTGFDPVIKRTEHRPSILITENDDKLHHLYMVDGGKIKYITVDLNTSDSTELIIEPDSESEIEIRFMMYSSLVMKLPLVYQNIEAVFKLIEEHKLEIAIQA
ncbi:hypothetical protein [Pectobacterium sp. B2J-2]|uniref:hypothetical protein n=1 Tax=Pectobacterium sp. B2J-2 TaxID=3385372 RepID=UPI0038FC6A8C